jgi:hypothetical protein
MYQQLSLYVIVFLKPIYLITTVFGDISDIHLVYADLKVQEYDNMLPGQGYHTTQDAVID